MIDIKLTHDQTNLIITALLEIKKSSEFQARRELISETLNKVLAAQNDVFASRVRGTRDHRLPID